jgi:NAD(P)-dependent dehydrogenase (short-subunit alcohol dehydrogenase family)
MRTPSKWDQEDRSNITVAAMDVTSEESIAALVKEIIDKDGKIDILVNNAGFGLGGYIESVTIDEAKAQFDTNVWGIVRCIQAVLPHMRKAMAGYIINISSTSGMRGIPCYEFYTGSKFALEGITDSLRYSLAPFNIAVTNINPGPVVTGFTDVFGHTDEGGKGSRYFEDDTGYLKNHGEKMINMLSTRMRSGEAQTVLEVAKVIVNQAVLKGSMKNIEDIPFNMGTSVDSQKVIDRVRVNPSGWGGIYSDTLKMVPSMSDVKPSV